MILISKDHEVEKLIFSTSEVILSHRLDEQHNLKKLNYTSFGQALIISYS